MTTRKISQLDAASTLDGSEILPVVQGGTTKKATVDQVVAAIPSGTYVEVDGDPITVETLIDFTTAPTVNGEPIGGELELGAVTDANVDDANKDGLGTVPGMRTLARGDGAALGARDPLLLAALGIDNYVFWDTGARADSVTLGTSDSGLAYGGGWSDGAYGIAGNQIVRGSGASVNYSMGRIAGVANGVYQGYITPGAAKTKNGLIFRGIDLNNFLLVALNDASGPGVVLYKYEAGSPTLLDQDATATQVILAYRLTVVYKGPRIAVLLDGERLFAHTLTGGDQTTFGAAVRNGLLLADADAKADNLTLSAL